MSSVGPLDSIIVGHDDTCASGGSAAVIRVFVADAHDLTRAGLCGLLAAQPGFVVVGEASDGAEAINLIARLRPDVVVLDAVLPGLDSIEATRQLRHRAPATAVVLMSTDCDVDRLMSALRAGAIGYVLKDVACAELLAVIQRAAAGEHAIEATLATGLLERMANDQTSNPRGPEPLTRRELEILDLISAGRTNQEIASVLIVAVGTVKVHVEHILAKLGVSGRTEAAVRGLELGILRRRSDHEPDRDRP